VISEVTRGRVDNENNNQSSYSNISNNIQSESLIYKLESIAIRTGTLEVWELEHRKVMSTGRRTQECDVRKEQEWEQEQEIYSRQLLRLVFDDIQVQVQI